MTSLPSRWTLRADRPDPLSALAVALGSCLLILSSCDTLGADEPDAPVIEYRGPQLSKDDATITDGMGFEQHWDAERDGQLVTLTRQVLCGDECNERVRLKLRMTGDELPEFESASFRRKESDGGSPFEVTEQRTLEDGQVAIQDWNLDGVVSGQVTGDLEFVFWYDFGT